MQPDSTASKPAVTNEFPELLRPAAVARMLGVSVPHVYDLATQGKIASFKVGRCVRFDPKDVLEFVRSCRRERIGS